MKHPFHILCHSSIVTCGDLIEPVFARFFQETVEFHEIIAEDIRIRGESFLVAFVDILYDAFLVLLAEIESMERKP